MKSNQIIQEEQLETLDELIEDKSQNYNNFNIVQLDANNGNCEKTEIEVIYDQPYELPIPFRKGYEFKGWYYKNTLIPNKSTWNFQLDKLTAEWEKAKLLSKPKVKQGPKIKYVNFGSYPQKRVTDENIVKAIISVSTSYHANSYKYYANNKKEDYMFYKDIDYIDGNKYRVVYFNKYRPTSADKECTKANSNQPYNGYDTNVTYVFKFEPIKWKENKIKRGNKILESELILDSQEFNPSTEDETINTSYDSNYNIHPNNYRTSAIREWLNHYFLETAFTRKEQKKIKKTLVINNNFENDNLDNEYACANVKDKVYLLSYSDMKVKKTNYTKEATDYAICQGLRMDKKIYWLRSPAHNGKIYASLVAGDSLSFGVVNASSFGVVPVINIESTKHKVKTILISLVVFIILIVALAFCLYYFVFEQELPFELNI